MSLTTDKSNTLLEDALNAPSGLAVSQGTDTKSESAKRPHTFTETAQRLNDAFGHGMQTLRHHTIDSVSRHIVNNSSNILGAAHVGTEMLMFKSSIKGAQLAPDAKNPIEWFYKAMSRVFSQSFKQSMQDVEEMKKAIKEKPGTGFFKFIKDTESATEREVRAHFKGEFKLGDTEQERRLSLEARQGVKLGNAWQTRSTLAGLIVWSLSAIIPDRKESAEEVERMAVKQNTNLLGYIGERLKQAVWFPDWPSHKRQMIGLGYAIIGVCSTLGSWRNSVKPDMAGLKLWEHEPALAKKLMIPQGPTYKFNGAYLATSLLSLASSIPLLFAVDDQKGFSGFGALMAGRLFFLPSSIRKKFGGGKGLGEDGAKYYLGATAAFQAENLAQTLIGGAEKLPDGSIVDHEEIKRKAREDAVKIKAERARNRLKEQRSEQFNEPSNILAQVASVEKAMPDRVGVEAANDDMSKISANAR